MSDGPDIAIIGMVGRFPGAADLDAFWDNLREGRSSIRRLTDAELDALGVEPHVRADPNFVPVAAPLEGIESFDAGFFGYSPREAELLDPQQRVFLEAAWAALEDAGYDPLSCRASVGVFAGATTSNYLLLNLASRPELLETGAWQLFVNNTGDSLATRVSYKLNLRGPSFTVQSACSTSLLAVHLACQSLLNEECDLALAGGVSINLAQSSGYVAIEGSLFATDGVCRPFDAAASGTVFGSGLGVVVLKRLADAIADRDPIRAVIRGSAVSNDGHLKVGFTAPSVEGQAAAIPEAISLSGVKADELSYLEAHGTGTALGDPIEIQAINRAFAATTKKKGFCALGSTKGAVGHLDVAAGVAGLIKTVLALEHEQLPPSAGYSAPNARIDFRASPVFVNATLTPWPRSPRPRLAGVSSFGLGGTNVHVIVEEGPASPKRSAAPQTEHLLVLSGKSPKVVEAAALRLAAHLEAHPHELADVAHTLVSGRHHFRHRRAVVASDLAEAVSELRRPAGAQLADETPSPTAFVFPGQGAQVLGMGAQLYRTEPAFRDAFVACSKVLSPLLGLELEQLVFTQTEGVTLGDVASAQPAIFAVEYALAQWWISRGLAPAMMLGHSAGEYVAACLAGVFSLDDALKVVATRGRLMQSMPRGGMLAMALSVDECSALAATYGLSLAATNEAAQCVVSGPLEGIEPCRRHLAERGIAHSLLAISHASHSSMMDPILEAFHACVAGVARKAPTTRFVSNVTGTWVRPEEAVDPAYWVRHLRQAVRFAEGLSTLAEQNPVIIEVGPGRTLSAIAKRRGLRAVASLETSEHEQRSLTRALGQVWAYGLSPDWSTVSSKSARRVSLPTYAFEQHRYWIDRLGRRAVDVASAPAVAVESTCPDARSDLEREVAAVWSELLGVQALSIHDDFFSLGGDSLLATQLVSRFRSRLGVEVPLKALLEGPTIEAMACLVVTTLSTQVPDAQLQALLSELSAVAPGALPPSQAHQ